MLLLDTHALQRITPSYVKMPPGYPKLICTGRSKLGEDNLNDQYVNVITGRCVVAVCLRLNWRAALSRLFSLRLAQPVASLRI